MHLFSDQIASPIYTQQNKLRAKLMDISIYAFLCVSRLWRKPLKISK